MQISNQSIRAVFSIRKLLVAATLGILVIFPSFLSVNFVLAAGSLSSVFAISTNNIVNTITTYDIKFKTGTTGKIIEVDMSFPAGFDISRGKLIEVSGISPGHNIHEWSDNYIQCKFSSSCTGRNDYNIGSK
jgi:hypothetical protein